MTFWFWHEHNVRHFVHKSRALLMESLIRKMTEMELAAQQARVKQEALRYGRGWHKVNEGTISLALTGCAGLGERWTRSGWSYCPHPGNCKAQKTIDEQQKRHKAAAV